MSLHTHKGMQIGIIQPVIFLKCNVPIYSWAVSAQFLFEDSLVKTETGKDPIAAIIDKHRTEICIIQVTLHYLWSLNTVTNESVNTLFLSIFCCQYEC